MDPTATPRHWAVAGQRLSPPGEVSGGGRGSDRWWDRRWSL